MLKPVILLATFCVLFGTAFSQSFKPDKGETSLAIYLKLEEPFRLLIPDDIESQRQLRMKHGVKGDSVFLDGILDKVERFNKEGRCTRLESYEPVWSDDWTPLGSELFRIHTYDFHARSSNWREVLSVDVKTDKYGKVSHEPTSHFWLNPDETLLKSRYYSKEGKVDFTDNQFDKKGNLITSEESQAGGGGHKVTQDLFNYIYDKNGRWIFERKHEDIGSGKSKLVESLYRYDSKGRFVESTTCESEFSGNPTSIYTRKGKLIAGSFRPEKFRETEEGWEVVDTESITDYTKKHYENDRLMQVDGLYGPVKKCQYDDAGRLISTVRYDEEGNMNEARKAIFADGLMLVRWFAVAEPDTNLPITSSPEFPGLHLIIEDSCMIDSSGPELILVTHQISTGPIVEVKPSGNQGHSPRDSIVRLPTSHRIIKWIVSADGALKWYQKSRIGGRDSEPFSETIAYSYDTKGLRIEMRQEIIQREKETVETHKYLY